MGLGYFILIAGFCLILMFTAYAFAFGEDEKKK
jgi:hypothetical protein